jgi:hypothetical protein
MNIGPGKEEECKSGKNLSVPTPPTGQNSHAARSGIPRIRALIQSTTDHPSFSLVQPTPEIDFARRKRFQKRLRCAQTSWSIFFSLTFSDMCS